MQQRSTATNPYYFTGEFSSIVVAPTAYNFVINFMSNHSAEEPSGCLDGYQFKSFFGVAGGPGSFVQQRGQERIPDNWYKRPSDTPYTLNDVFKDVLLTYLAYPDTLLMGGYTGKPNSFAGISLSDFLENVFGVENLDRGDKFACFATELLQQGLPDAPNLVVNDTAPLVEFVADAFSPFRGKLSCPEIGKYDFTLSEQFPGYRYHPPGPSTNY